MANHLEQLISEWLEFKGYFVRRNVKVGKLSHGGHEGELDIVAYHPIDDHLVQIEPSIDPHSWGKREVRFRKKFKAGRKYIIPEIFPWLPRDTWLHHNKKFEQWAVLWGSRKNHPKVGGGTVVPLWDLCQRISHDIMAVGKVRLIPEQFPLLRTMQFTMRWVKARKAETEVDAELRVQRNV